MKPLERILYVEDDPDIREIARLSLESLGGFGLTVCCSGLEALEKATRENHELILMDVMMPGMDGPETLEKLRTIKACENLPVVFMTAKVQPGEIEEYRKLGVIDVIHKPFDPMTLSQRVGEIWSRFHE